jgi:predicted nuclease of predicted toxin-antitoxin system
MSPQLKLLVDVSAGTAITDWLRSAGHDVVAVREVDARMKDTDILAWAVSEQRLVVTMDKDFGELVHRWGQSHTGVLLLRLESVPNDEKVRITAEIFAKYGDQLAGHFCVYQDGRLRIR